VAFSAPIGLARPDQADVSEEGACLHVFLAQDAGKRDVGFITL
jgi:hypothetical protein